MDAMIMRGYASTEMKCRPDDVEANAFLDGTLSRGPKLMLLLFYGTTIASLLQNKMIASILLSTTLFYHINKLITLYPKLSSGVAKLLIIALSKLYRALW